ncbi:MAG: glycoside hydrolase family 11 protein [Lachnospiraceae bacterium]|nr:glycoside hydrolase family 11 protein [Lachnospiraceae bacterium]
MKRSVKAIILAVVLCLELIAPKTKSYAVAIQHVLYNNGTIQKDGYFYQVWADKGGSRMTIYADGSFECNWDRICNAEFIKGKKFGSTQNALQAGNINVSYDVTFKPGGNDFMCVHGWMMNPLIEYFVVDNWGAWRPNYGVLMARYNINGGLYDLYVQQVHNLPSPAGNNTTFKRYWLVRQDKISWNSYNLYNCFNAFKNRNLPLGNLYSVEFLVNAYQSAGSVKVNSFDIRGNK